LTSDHNATNPALQKWCNLEHRKNLCSWDVDVFCCLNLDIMSNSTHLGSRYTEGTSGHLKHFFCHNTNLSVYI
jgi:hypothetical protein